VQYGVVFYIVIGYIWEKLKYMKQSDIDRLKEKLGDEYELVTQSPDENDKFFVVIAKKKDPWDGVEFAECCLDGWIYKMDQLSQKVLNLNPHKPSTEAAYVSQLKAKANELYGEIKEGDLFESATGGEYTVKNFEGQKLFDYFKRYDQLFYRNVEIYQCGQWAKKVERFKVDSNGGSINSQAFYFRWGQKEKEKMQDIGFVELCDYLAKCLEDKLNEKAGA
jgi:hypothetical protein